jgi:hypothetical protein
MVRCQNCGYNNQSNAPKCIKCQTLLSGAEEEVTPPVPEEEVKLPVKTSKGGKTQRDVQINVKPWDNWTGEIGVRNSEPIITPKPTVVPEPPQINDSGKTMRRVVPTSKTCSLVALSMDDESELRSVSLKGENVLLNRDILDAGNTSISRKGHATLVFKDGAWWIENLTELKTTFIQVNSPVKLADGDVLLLGDALFRFKEGG